jgi:spermidine synthase
MIFWAAHFRDSLFKVMLQAVNAKRIWIVALVFCTLIILYASLKRRKGAGIKERASLIAVLAIGFTQMSLQMMILLSFQAIYGYVFYKLSLIITFFMAGLALGGSWIARVSGRISNGLKFLVSAQAATCIYLFLLPWLLSWLSRSHQQYISWLGQNLIFLFLSAIAGFIAGGQFTLANKIYLNGSNDAGRAAGLSYGMDLLGSCLGAFLTAIFLIPVLGIPQTCWLAALLNFTVLIFLFLSGRPNVKTQENKGR